MSILNNLDSVFERARRRVHARVDISAAAHLLDLFRERVQYTSCADIAFRENMFLLRNYWRTVR